LEVLAAGLELLAAAALAGALTVLAFSVAFIGEEDSVSTIGHLLRNNSVFIIAQLEIKTIFFF
jgi:hypothetical protein